MQTKIRTSRLRSSILSALKKNPAGSTVADVVAATAIPNAQVADLMPRIADEFSAHLRVTESGEILYHFPQGFKNRHNSLRSRLRATMRRVGTVLGKILTVFFKVWISVMLIGYFVLFVGIVVLTMLASVAGSAAGRGRSRGGGFLSFYFTMRIAEMFLWIWFARGPRARGKSGRPLRQSVHSFVFGEPDPNADWAARERQTVLAFLRANRGIITADELMTLTGRTPDDTQSLLNGIVVEYQGDVDVTDEGTLVYRFSELLRSGKGQVSQKEPTRVPDTSRPPRSIRRFSSNPPKTNRWMAFFNVFNAGFGMYFLNLALANPLPRIVIDRGVQKLVPDGAYMYHMVNLFLQRAGLEGSVSIILVGLGVIPVVFSLFFFLIPLFRRFRERRQNEETRKENLRRSVYRAVLNTPGEVSPDEFRPTRDEETPRNPREVVERELARLAAARSADVEYDETGRLIYRFSDVERDASQAFEARKKLDLSQYDLGDAVFDTNQ